jgi:hypothetical protein
MKTITKKKSTKPAVMTKSKSKAKPAATRGIPTTFWIQPDDLTRLREFAADHDLSASNVINRALRRFLSDPNPFFRP